MQDLYNGCINMSYLSSYLKYIKVRFFNIHVAGIEMILKGRTGTGDALVSLYICLVCTITDVVVYYQGLALIYFVGDEQSFKNDVSKP